MPIGIPMYLEASLPEYMLEALAASDDAFTQLSMFEDVTAERARKKAFASHQDVEGFYDFEG